MQLTKDGKTAFVALGPANRVAVVDVASHTVKSYILTGQRVWHLALTPEEDRLFTTNGVSNDVTVIQCGGPEAREVGQSRSLPMGHRRACALDQAADHRRIEPALSRPHP